MKTKLALNTAQTRAKEIEDFHHYKILRVRLSEAKKQIDPACVKSPLEWTIIDICKEFDIK